MMDLGPSFMEMHIKATNDPCPTSPTNKHNFTLQASVHSPTIHVETCKYCGVTWSSLYLEAEDDFVDGLDRTEAYYDADGFIDVLLTAPFSYISPVGDTGYGYSSFDTDAFHSMFVLSSLSDMEVAFTCVSTVNSTGYCPVTYVYTEPFTWSYPSASYSVTFNVWPWDCKRNSSYYCSNVVLWDITDSSDRDCTVREIYDGRSSTGSFVTKTINFTFVEGNEYQFAYMCQLYGTSLARKHVFELGAYPVVSSVYSGSTNVTVQPSNTDPTSRLSALANSLNQYNLQHNIQDNDQHVNFVLVPVDVEPSLDTSISPAIYNEETLVYTDPVTGAEYLTNGWTYDYLTRCYTLDMADGFTIGDAAIDTIKLTYGDELLTVEHYSGGSLIQTDEYNYVMMSGSECGLNGHTYTYEETKTPTCTSTGERKYTCSVCGNQYAEHLPMKEHAYTYSVLKEPTCIDPGISVYTCSTCGNQVTENTDALGHDWQETSSTTTTYTVPEGTSCPDCAGADYALELDEDNGVYRLTCNGCGAVWVVPAEITYGATVYTCTRCGATKTESDDPDSGLFNAIGDLIADGITWVTDKLAELINSLTVMMENFNAYLDSVKNSGGQFPAFLAAIFGLFPQDFMNVIWFSLIAVIVLLVWKKWFS